MSRCLTAYTRIDEVSLKSSRILSVLNVNCSGLETESFFSLSPPATPVKSSRSASPSASSSPSPLTFPFFTFFPFFPRPANPSPGESLLLEELEEESSGRSTLPLPFPFRHRLLHQHLPAWCPLGLGPGYHRTARWRVEGHSARLGRSAHSAAAQLGRHRRLHWDRVGARHQQKRRIV